MRRAAYALLFTALALSGAVMSVCVLGRSAYHWHGFAVEARLLPALQGQTRLVLTPLGEVRAPTHVAPVALIVALQEIQIEEIRRLLAATPKRNTLADDFERTARADLRNFVLRQAVLASAGALLAPILLRSRRFRAYAVSSLLGMGAMGLVIGSALSSFNGKAFESPTYTGTLKQAPWVIQFGRDAFTRIEALSTKLRTVAGNLNVLYGRIAAVSDHLAPEDSPDTVRVLHVSDLHNNKAALDFIREVADQFKVQFIVDTGDLTDFGSPPETLIVQGIARLPYPYLFVLGNHDSQAVSTALAQVANVTVLNGQVVEEKGLTLLGAPNPAAARAGLGSVDTTPAELQQGGESLLRAAQALPTPPDVIAVHDPEQSRPLWGRVPLILCGHEHRAYVQIERAVASAPATGTTAAPAERALAYTTVLCNAGTTGAAGLRYFEKEQGVPFSCAVLTFRRALARLPLPASPPATHAADAPPAPPASVNSTLPAVRPQLRAIDRIVLNGTLGEYSITHQTFDSVR